MDEYAIQGEGEYSFGGDVRAPAIMGEGFFYTFKAGRLWRAKENIPLEGT